MFLLVYRTKINNYSSTTSLVQSSNFKNIKNHGIVYPTINSVESKSINIQTGKKITVNAPFAKTSTATVVSIPQFNQLIPKTSAITVVSSIKLEEIVAKTSTITMCTP